ncbi:MAG: NOB1 family endonuclease [Candidatus Bathyarchaeaceae archaeon]
MDTSAFIAGFDPLSAGESQYSVPMVRKELASKSMPWVRFKAAVENRKLRVRKPKISFLKKVKEASKSVGNVRYLSEADMQVLALALELKSTGLDPLIVTDDYSIQNVANQMGVNFTSLMTYGIRFRFDWILYCPACHRKYPPDYKFKSCEICGTELKRKPLRKTPL